MDPPRKKTAAELLAAAKAKLAATRKNRNDGSARANSRPTSPARSESSRSSSVSRGRTIANQLAQAETRARLLRKKEANAIASSMSNLEGLAAKVPKRGIHNEVSSLDRKIASLERSHAAKLQAAENYKERRSSSRGRYEQESLAAPQWARPGVRTSQRKAANNKVEAINKDYKRMLREASVVETALRHAKEARMKKTGKMESMASSAATSRSTSPTGSVRSTSTTQSRRLTANELETKAANLRRRLTAKQNRNRAAAKKKENSATRKLADAYKKLEGFDDDVLDAFCEELRQRRRGAAGAAAAARAVVAASISNSNSKSNSNSNNKVNLR